MRNGLLVGSNNERVEFSGAAGFTLGSVNERPDRAANSALALAAPELYDALNKALATLQAVYQWIDRVNDAGGATSISGVASCNAMLKSLNGNRDRFQSLIVDPGNLALRRARAAQVPA